ncbi:MAG: hypothetical protein Q7K33_00935 [Candidatus Berkelbacteria bacterium]|nr:hypothetical protein [Candidatus Berkelbacteria bacterium]
MRKDKDSFYVLRKFVVDGKEVIPMGLQESATRKLSLLVAGKVGNRIFLVLLPGTIVAASDWEFAKGPQLLAEFCLRRLGLLAYFSRMRRTVPTDFDWWGHAFVVREDDKIVLYDVDDYPLTEEVGKVAQLAFA